MNTAVFHQILVALYSSKVFEVQDTTQKVSESSWF
jgi:hypothetical protein